MNCGFSEFRNRTPELINKPKKYKSIHIGNVVVPPILDAKVKGFNIKVIDGSLYPFIQHTTDINLLKNIPAMKPVDNSPSIDIFFCASEFILFLSKELGFIDVDENLFFVANIPNYDNAYYDGCKFVFGNGNQMKPLTSIDVIGHEIGHMICKNIAGLEYKGHSGALNESLADCLSLCFEFWIYRKYNSDKDNSNDLIGIPDWLIGEDVIKKRYSRKKSMRNFIQPEQCNCPSKVNGQYYIDPLSNIDHGGVHYNSSIINHMFYKLTSCQMDNMYDILGIWYRCYKNLNNKNSTFSDLKEY